MGKFKIPTDDLDKLIRGAPFILGPVNLIHEVGIYHIVEYLTEDDKLHYFAYVEKTPLRSSPSFDGALLIAIAHNSDNDSNTRAILNVIASQLK